MVAIIGGEPRRFRPLVDLYRRSLGEGSATSLPVGAHSPGHVAATDDEALEQLWPHYRAMHDRIGADRGWPQITREQFDVAAGPSGALVVGSPDTVAAKIVMQSTLLQAGMAPVFGKRPGVGLMPTRLLKAAGTRPEPAVSVPSAKAARPEATVTADPELEPPEI